MTKMTHGAATD